MNSEGQLEYTSMEKNPSGMSRGIRGQGDDLDWPLGSSLGGVRDVKRFAGGKGCAPVSFLLRHSGRAGGVGVEGRKEGAGKGFLHPTSCL